jgi:hypothetical protein
MIHEKDKDKYESNKLDNNIDDDFAELDTTWISKFEEEEKDYNNYYSEDLSFIRVNYIYINKSNEIINISEEKCIFKIPGILSKEELIGLIKRNTIHNTIKYSLLSILKFNINFDPIHLKTFIRSPDIHIGNKYIQSLTNIDTIIFEKAITLFHDINNLYIIFIDKSDIAQSNLLRNHNFTKRIYINSSRKQTKRNHYSEST